MSRTTVGLALSTAALCSLLAGCAGAQVAETADAPVVAVGVSMPQGDSRWKADGENMAKQLAALGYETDLQNADKDPAKQAEQISAMIDRGDKVLVIGAVDGTALKDVLGKAAAKKIPVIAYDRLIRDSPDVDYYATFDNFKVGVLQATSLVRDLGAATARQPVEVELFAGSPDDNNATFFFNGAMSVLQPLIASGKVVVPSGQTSFQEAATQGWDGAVAKARMAKILSTTDASVTLDGVLSPYDGLSRGILEALQADGYGGSGKKIPAVTGQDAELESVKLLAAGTQSQTVFKDTRELAKVAVQMTNALLTGEKPSVNDTEQYDNGAEVVPTFLLQPVSVDRDNFRAVLVDSGYYQASELS